jgi:hypothetical protein
MKPHQKAIMSKIRKDPRHYGLVLRILANLKILSLISLLLSLDNSNHHLLRNLKIWPREVKALRAPSCLVLPILNLHMLIERSRSSRM